MITIELVKFSVRSLQYQGQRAVLSTLGIAIGIGAVVMLTSAGETLRHYLIDQFTQFGTNVIAVTPGKISTFGMSVGVFGAERPLNLEDSESLRSIFGVEAVVPAVQGNARVESSNRQRRTTVLGVGHDMLKVWKVDVAIGIGLPADNPEQARPFAILGPRLRQELFGSRNPLGKQVRIASTRFRVIGVLQPKGSILGFDLDEVIYIPAARALQLFNREGLMEIDLVYGDVVSGEAVVREIKRVLTARHGREDFSVTTQDAMLDTMGDVLSMLTTVVAGLGSISLLVGGIGILTIMIISVYERKHEIGVLRAIGATQRQVLLLFLSEAVILAVVGGFLGILISGLLLVLVSFVAVDTGVEISWFYVILSVCVSILIGFVGGLLPANQAAQMQPVDALRGE